MRIKTVRETPVTPASNSSTKRGHDSPGDGPGKKIGNFPDVGSKISIINKEGHRHEYLV